MTVKDEIVLASQSFKKAWLTLEKTALYGFLLRKFCYASILHAISFS
jgi:hypothetical protein